MIIRKSRILIMIISLVVLLTYSFPFASYIRLLLIGSYAFYMIFHNLRASLNENKIYILSYILFCIWAVLSYGWASYSNAVSEQLFNLLSTVLTNIIFTLFIIKKKEYFQSMLIWLYPVFVIYIFQSIFVGNFDSSMRFSSTGATNQFGISISYIYLILLYAIKTKQLKSKLVIPILFISLVLSLLTGSRKTLINIVLFTILVFCFSKYDKNFLKIFGKVVLGIIIALILLLIVMNVDILYDVLGSRIESLFLYFSGDVTVDLSALRREYMKEDAISLFLSHPITGVGLNNFKYIARYDTYAHSNYYEMLSCLGIIGTVLYYFPTFILLKESIIQWRNNYKDAIVPLAIVVSFIIDEFSNVSYMYCIIHIFLGIAAGMLLSNNLDMRKTCQNKLIKRQVIIQ